MVLLLLDAGFYLGSIWVRFWFDLGCSKALSGFYSGFMLSVFGFYFWVPFVFCLGSIGIRVGFFI